MIGTAWTVFGGRLVLDQLDQPVAIDHLARRHGHVAARCEGRGIDHGEAALLQVGQQVLRAGGEAGSSGLHGLAQRRRIGQQQQGRAHGGDELLEMEIEALPLGITAGFDGLAVLEQPVRGQQVHLLEGPVDRVLVPFRGGEALVAALLRVGRGRLGKAPPALAGLVPVGDRRLPEPGVEFGRRAQAGAGTGQRPDPDGAQRTGDLRPVHRHDLAHRVGVPHLVDRAQQRVARQDLVSCRLPAASMLPARSSGVTCHQGLALPVQSCALPKLVSIHDIQRPSATSGRSGMSAAAIPEAAPGVLPCDVWERCSSACSAPMAFPPTFIFEFTCPLASGPARGPFSAFRISVSTYAGRR